jgi:hypothetical protein
LVSVESIFTVNQIVHFEYNCLGINFYLLYILIVKLKHNLFGRRGEQIEGLNLYGQPHVEGHILFLLLFEHIVSSSVGLDIKDIGAENGIAFNLIEDYLAA